MQFRKCLFGNICVFVLWINEYSHASNKENLCPHWVWLCSKPSFCGQRPACQTQAYLARIHPPVILSWLETCGEPLVHAWSPWSPHCSSKYGEMEFLYDGILGGIGGRSIPCVAGSTSICFMWYIYFLLLVCITFLLFIHRHTLHLATRRSGAIFLWFSSLRHLVVSSGWCNTSETGEIWHQLWKLPCLLPCSATLLRLKTSLGLIKK